MTALLVVCVMFIVLLSAIFVTVVVPDTVPILVWSDVCSACTGISFVPVAAAVPVVTLVGVGVSAYTGLTALPMQIVAVARPNNILWVSEFFFRVLMICSFLSYRLPHREGLQMRCTNWNHQVPPMS